MTKVTPQVPALAGMTPLGFTPTTTQETPAMYDSTNFPSPIYDVTAYAVYRVEGEFLVHDVLDMLWFHCGDSLRHALEYADNGELSPEALRVLAT